MKKRFALLLLGCVLTSLAVVPASAAPQTGYYTGDYQISLELYSFNANLNAYDLGRKGAPPLSPLDAIKWAKTAGFDAVDVTAYYFPGYSGTAMPTKPKATILAYADQVKALAKQLGLAISGTGIGSSTTRATSSHSRPRTAADSRWPMAPYRPARPRLPRRPTEPGNSDACS